MRERNPGQDNPNRNNRFGQILWRRRRRGNGRSLQMSTLRSCHRSRRRFCMERLPSLSLLSFQTREARRIHHRRQDEETVNSLTTEPDEQLDKARYFSEPDVRWGYDNEHIEDKWEMTRINQTLFEPTVICSSPYSPTTSQITMNETFQSQKSNYQTIETKEEQDIKNTRRSRDSDLFTEQEGCTPWVVKTEHEGILYFENQPQTNPTKLDGIAEWPTPTTAKEVESFLGFGNFDTELTQNDEDLVKPQNKQDKDEQDNRDMVMLPAKLFLNLLNHKFDDE